MKKNKIVVIAGPTGVGKTKLSVMLAKKMCTDIISADSMQIYRGMDIGTAKVTLDEMQGVRHHLLDIVNPDEEFDVVEYRNSVIDIVNLLHNENKIPILVGGTGFYIQSVIRDVEFTEHKDTEYREVLYKLSLISDGKDILYNMLCAIDAESAKVIHKNNVKKVIRALEFFKENGYSIQNHNAKQREKTNRYNVFFYLLTDDREKLYENINLRVIDMFNNGLVDEVKKLIDEGIKSSTTAMQAIGYKEVIEYLDNKITLEECIYKVSLASRRYAKRQLTWFKREKDIEIINKSDYNNFEEIVDKIYNDIIK